MQDSDLPGMKYHLELEARWTPVKRRQRRRICTTSTETESIHNEIQEVQNPWCNGLT